MSSSKRRILVGALATAVALTAGFKLAAEERLAWQQAQYQPQYQTPGGFQQSPVDEPYRPGDLPPPSGYQAPPPRDTFRPADPYRQEGGYGSAGRPPAADAYRAPQQGRARVDDAYRPPQPYNAPPAYSAQPPYDPPGGQGGFVDNYRRGQPYGAAPPPRDDAGSGYGVPYSPAPQAGEEPYDRGYERGGPPPPPRDRGPGYANDRTYSKNEILSAGHSFFGSISSGLASVIEHAFQQSGRPNGYILGEDAGGAFVAGLRYGEGVLHTKDAGNHRVYWQGPSLGYDFGAEGSKTMVLVYNLRDPQQIYDRFGGVQGSAYVVGGVSIQFQKNDDVVLAPIRAGIGLRLGANVGYLKYTRTPTWNPF